MAENPLKYSDFIQPDGSISDLIKQLETALSTYNKMRDEVVSSAKEIESALKKVNNTNSEGQETTRKGVTEADRLARAEENLARAKSETGKQIISLRAEQNEQNRINRLTKKLNESAEGSYDRLSAQYSLNKLRLNQMSAAERAANTEGGKLETQTRLIYEEMNRLQKATGKSQLQVGQYERGIGKMTESFQGMPGPIGRVVGGFKQMTMAAKAFIATPVGLILAAFVAAGAVIKKVISTSRDFEAQMSRVEAITGASALEIEHLSNNAKELGRTTTKTAEEVGKLQEEFAKLGFSTTEILNATEATIALSEATGSDLAQSAKVAASTLRGFGLDASETNRVVDVMTRSFSSSALDLGKFEVAMSKLAPAAKANNVSIEETTALLGVLADSGIDASTAGTSLRNMFLELTSKGLTFDEALDMVRNSQDKSATSLELFGKRGAITGLVLADNAEKTAELTEQLYGAEGAADDMAATVRDNLNGDIKALTSSWDGLFLSIDDGNGIINKISRFFIQTLTKILIAFSKFKEAFARNWNDLIEGSTLFRIAVATIESTFSLVFGNIGTMIKTMAKSLGGLGKIIKSALTGDLKGIKDGWNDITSSVIEGAKGIGKNAMEAGKNLYDAYTGDSMDKYLMKAGMVVESLEDQSSAAEDFGDTIDDTYDKSAEGAEKDKENRIKIEEEKYKLLFDVMEEGLQKEMIALEKSYEEKKELFQRYGLDLNKLEEWRRKQAESIHKKYDEKEAKEIEKQKAEDYKRAQTQIDQEYNLRVSEIDIMEITEAEKTRLRLEAEKDRLKKVLELNKSMGGDLSDMEIEIVRNTMKKIDQEIEDSMKKMETSKKKDFYSMVGLDLSEEQKSSIASSTQYAIENVKSFLQARVDAAQRAVDASQREVDAKRDNVQAEIEANRMGYASNVDLARKELETAKKNQEKALREQEKAQKAQEAIDTLTQVSSMVTASAGIWKSFAGVGPWGVAAAIASIALMWGSFAASKLKAKELTKQEYADGGLQILSGGSHRSGNDISLGVTQDGVDHRAEGGEAMAIINRKNTRKYSKLLPNIVDSLNKGVFEQKYGSSYNTGGFGIQFNPANLKGLESDVRAIKDQGSRRYYIDAKGRTIEIYKNLKRIHNAN